MSLDPSTPQERDAVAAPDALAAPLPGESPCGPDLGHEAPFQALLEAAAGRPERQYGDKVYPAEPPAWPTVRTHALALAERTRDLRLAVWLVRAEARTGTWTGVVDRLALLHALLDRFWAQLHPQLDASEGDDPTERLNALFPLHHEEGLADLRAARLTRGRQALGVRPLELAFGRAEPRPGEAVPAEAALLQAVREAQAADPALAASMQAGAETARRIGALLEARLGTGRSPDLAPLLRLLDAVAVAGQRAQPGPAAAATGPASAADGPQGDEIRSRADAIRMLDRVCAWLGDNEPTHPAPLLIQRAQRLLAKKNFLDVIRDLVPEGVGQIEKLAGPGNQG